MVCDVAEPDFAVRRNQKLLANRPVETKGVGRQPLADAREINVPNIIPKRHFGKERIVHLSPVARTVYSVMHCFFKFQFKFFEATKHRCLICACRIECGGDKLLSAAYDAV